MAGAGERDDETKEIEVPTADRIADLACTRISLAMLVCEGLDECMLRLLASKNKDGRTNLQHILDHVTWPPGAFPSKKD